MSSDTEGLLESQRHGDGQAASSVIVQEPADKAWAVAFIINVAITFFSAIYFSWSAWPALREGMQWDPSQSLEMAIVEGMLIVPSVFAVSGILLRAMVHCPRLMLQIAFVLAVLVCVGAVKSLPSAEMVLGAIGLVIVCIPIVDLFTRRRGTISFAASNLKAAALAISSTPNIMSWALFMMITRAIWLVAVVFAVLGSVVAFASTRNGNAEIEGVIILLVWALSVVWQFTVIGNVVAATVASSMASWCSSPDNVESVWLSFHWVLHLSLGPLCKAVVVDGIVGLFLGVTSFIYSVTVFWTIGARLAVNVTGYAAYFVGMYGLGFPEGADRASAMCRSHGLTILPNNILIVAGASVLLAMASAGFFIGENGKFRSSSRSLNLAATALTHAVIPAMVVTFEVVIHAFNAVFVYAVQDTEAFAEVHGDRDHSGVYRAWRRLRREDPMVAEDAEGVQV